MADQYESYNYDYDKHMFSGKSGKGRSKKEAEMNTNKNDPGGHTRKTVTKLMNNHHNEISQRSASQTQHSNQSWTQALFHSTTLLKNDFKVFLSGSFVSLINILDHYTTLKWGNIKMVHGFQ